MSTAERRSCRCVEGTGCLRRPVWGVLVRRADVQRRPWVEVLPVCPSHLRPTGVWDVARRGVVPLATLRDGRRDALPASWSRLDVRWRR